MQTPPATPPRNSQKTYPKSLNNLGYTIAILYSALSVLSWSILTFNYSSPIHQNYSLYAHRLSNGWLFGRKIDNSDTQYAGFRNNIPILFIVMLMHTTISFLVTRNHTYTLINAKQRVSMRSWWSFVFSVSFLGILFGASILKIFIIISVHYCIVKCLDTNTARLFSWIFGLSLLFSNYYFDGYKFAYFIPFLEWLDAVKGMGLRWHITFNFTILRMISYTTDKHWSAIRNPAFEVHLSKCNECDGMQLCELGRIEKNLDIEEYGFVYYLTYLVYAPLYMAGPIISFNNFTSQMKNIQRTRSAKETFIYMLKWIGIVLVMEVFLHCFYVVAIKDSKSWTDFTPYEIFTLGYFNLNIIWLKLMIIWRFFRLWAMLDGIETVENMNRCMSNNYSGIEFWRGWHTSFNKWLIRYIYVPLGGKSRRVVNSFLIFTFVAVWHDIELKLLAWGWLITVFLLPEVYLTKLFCTTRNRARFGDLHLHICALGGALNIFTMMAANLVGFALGVDGMMELAGQLVTLRGFLSVVVITSSLFAFVHVQFKYMDRKAAQKDIKQF